jgi:CheY-like chemotaxis protein
MRILAIDEDPDTLRGLARALEKKHDVTTVQSASEAFYVLAGDESFDAILCDLDLPGLSGADFAARLAPFDAARLVFMASGASAAAQATAVAGHPVLAKPFTDDELYEAVGSLGFPYGAVEPSMFSTLVNAVVSASSPALRISITCIE